jgi:hypothetical protein
MTAHKLHASSLLLALSLLPHTAQGLPQTLSFTATGGATQTAPIGAPFAVPLQVTASNNGVPLQGVTINFTAPTTGATATLSSLTAVTNAQGVASITATAGFAGGSYMVTASYQGASASFALTNTAVASITATGGTPQSTAVGTPFAVPLQVTVKDTVGNPVAGVTVNFGGPLSGAGIIVSSPTAVTNAQGVASVTASANAIAGTYTAFAVAGSLAASFQLTNTAGSAVSIMTITGTPQTTNVGAPFSIPLQVTVRDTAGNAVPGITVNFAAPASGASAVLSSSTAVTDVSGAAGVTATANAITGGYTVTANAGNLFAFFSLTNNVSGPATGITAVGGTPQSALLSTAFSIPLQVGVKDVNGLPVSGVTVNFIAPASGASATLSIPSAITNSLGVASVIATANSIAGSYVVTASEGGLSTTFSLTNLATGQSSNLAIGKSTSQSSTLPGSSGPAVAVDGNTNGDYFSGSVTHTNFDTNAWWQVDLGGPASITSVSIWNRTDCCSDRLNDYWVFVSSTPFLSTDTPATLQNRAATFAIHQTTAPNPSTIVTIPGGGMQGQYVRVQLSGTNNLSLAEVQVTGTSVAPTATNLAQGKPATQSSTLAGYTTDSASAAVDGNTDGNFFDGSVTHTNADSNAWWQVDLGSSSIVTSVVVWNRTDACCISRLSDYWVFVSDTPFLSTDTPATLQGRAGTFSSHQITAPTPSTTIVVGAQGRYVRVQINGVNNLNLAEVQVFGTSTAPTNIAVGRTATQSSTLPGFVTANASSAVDGNPNGNFFSGSVTHTNADTNAWWQLDLGSSASVSSIVVWNRTDCCADRLSDYWVFVSDTPFMASDTPATLSGRAGTFASHQMVTPSPSTMILVGAQGRYVRVQLSGTNNLSLAEVQVFGTGGGPVPSRTDLAQGMPAAQSSTLAGTPSAAPGSAVDGNTDGNFYDNSVSHTNPEPNPWWQVDLGVSTAVSSVVVWNRTDCCGTRLGDYWVFVSDIPFLVTDTPTTLQGRVGTFSSHQTTAPNPSTTIPVAFQGRYVRVQLTGGDVLSLAEVQVYGQ